MTSLTNARRFLPPSATTWGTSKKAYYNADEGSDLDEMREEEEEALKIQKQRLADMDEADFMDDTLSGWGIGAEANKEADRQLVESVTKDLDDISFE
jgi:U3 small nucleolar RNA-associated protein 3